MGQGFRGQTSQVKVTKIMVTDPKRRSELNVIKFKVAIRNDVRGQGCQGHSHR